VTVDLAAQLLVYGLVLGAVYGLVAIGLTLVFGVLDVLNAAHGIFYTIGGYVAWYCVSTLGLAYLPTLLVAGVAGAVSGVVCEKVAVARIRTRPNAVMIATFCFALLVESIITATLGNSPREVPTAYNTGILMIGNVVVNHQRILVFVVTILLFLGVGAFVRYAPIGLAMRAVARDMPTAALMGVKVSRVYVVTFALSAFLAAVSGALLAPLFSVEPSNWSFSLIKAFVVVLLGGAGSIFGAFVGGLTLGVMESFGASWSAAAKDGIGLALLIGVLLWRPQGLFGRTG
jgi:branched-chain amino acid transport system permease protein